jgi:hypothetical protein
MRVAGVREFRNRAPAFIKGRDIVFVTSHGKLSGVLVPLAGSPDLPVEVRREFLGRFGAAMADHLRRRGVSEGSIQRDFKAWRKARRARRRGRQRPAFGRPGARSA